MGFNKNIVPDANLHAKYFPDPLKYVVLVFVVFISLTIVRVRVCFCFCFNFWFSGFRPKVHVFGDKPKAPLTVSCCSAYTRCKFRVIHEAL